MLPDCTHDPEGLALLMNCKENPLDVAPRLILTDWLEEHGEEALAETLRRSIKHPDHIHGLPLHVQRRWWPLNSCQDGWLWCLLPHQRTELELDRLTDCPWFCGLRVVSFRPAETRGVLQHPATRHLVAINTEGYWPTPEEEGLTPLPYLFYLNIASQLLSDRDVIAVANDPRLTAVSQLDISMGNLSQLAIEALGQAPWVFRLQKLSISISESGRRALFDLLQTHDWPLLEILHFRDTPIRDSGIEELDRCAFLPRLQEIRLQQADVWDAGLNRLCHGLPAGSLQRLQISYNPLEDQFGPRFVTSSMFANLQELDLTWTRCGGITLEAIMLADATCRLRKLNFSGNQRLDTGNLDFLRRSTLPGLTHLDLSYCELSSQTLVHLMQSPIMQTLTILDISQNRFAIAGMLAIKQAPEWHVTELFLSQCLIESVGVQFLADSVNLQTIRTLDLSENGISERGMMALARTSHVSNLEHLSLNDNPIGDEGLHYLMQAPWFSQLKSLDLSSCYLTSESLSQLFEMEMPRLISLRLWGNTITNHLLARLRACPFIEQLTELGLSINDQQRAFVDGLLDLAHVSVLI